MKSKLVRPPKTKAASPSGPVQDPPPMEEVFEIIRLMGETRLSEIELETPTLKISLKKNTPVPSVPVPASFPMGSIPMAFVSNGTPGTPAPAPVETRSEPKLPPGKPEKAAPPVPQKTYHKILSPMAGTFYRAPSPSSPPYVNEGDTVTLGKPVCIVEAMKLMNEIKADKPGRVIKIHVANTQPVEKGTILFEIDLEPAA